MELDAERERCRLEEERQRRDQARIDRLISESKALQQAETISGYVEAARQAGAQLGQPVSNNEMNAWAVTALTQADRIDPVMSGALLIPEKVRS